MTVESTSRKQSFAGAQSSLSFSFKTLPAHPEYIKVLKTLISTGVDTDLTYNVDYTVSLNADGVGGIVTVSPTFSALYNMTVYRDTDDLQDSDYNDFNQFPASTLEDDLDRRTLISQEKSDDVDRTAKLPISSSVTSVVLPEPVDGEVLTWSGTNGTLVGKAISALGAIVVDTDNTLAANSDSRVASQKAIKSYITTTGTSLIQTVTGGTLALNMVFDGGGSVLTTSSSGKMDFYFPVACEITEVTVLADQSGSIVFDLWVDTYANYPPTVADTITASAKPTLSSATKAQDSTLTGWTKAIAAGKTLRVNIDSVSTCTRVVLCLKLKKTQF